MKNYRSYRLPAILLVIVMAFCLLLASAIADGEGEPNAQNQAEGILTQSWYYPFDATSDASFSYSSGNNQVSNLADLDPSKTSTMTVTVANSAGLPQDANYAFQVTIPDNVQINEADAAACVSDDVSCTYVTGSNQLTFRWKVDPKTGFTATIPFTPNVAATVNVAGNYVIVGEVPGTKVVGAIKAAKKSNTLLAASALSYFEDKLNFGDNDAYLWKFTQVSGDWYTISNGSNYMQMDGATLTLTGRDNATVFHVKLEDKGYVIESNGYYVNISKDNPANGVKGSNWSPRAQWMKLYPASELFDADNSDKGYIKLDKNGGNTNISPDMISGEIGSTVTLPNYTGTKSGCSFVGWAEVSNIRAKVDGSCRYYDVYLPGSEYTVEKGMKSLYAVWMTAGGEHVKFGIKQDGKIPYEPGNYPVSSYTPDKDKVYIKNNLKESKWVIDTNTSKRVEGNHVVNNVTANLKVLPTDEELKQLYHDYDPETMHVLWYVIKYQGQSYEGKELWHVDGVILKDTPSVMYYPGFTGHDAKSVFNLTQGYQVEAGTTITIGSESNKGNAKKPTREGYIFKGWTTTEDGSGTLYQSGDKITVNGNVDFYAQWEIIPKYEVKFALNNAAEEAVEKLPAAAEYEKENTIKLPEAEERDGYFFSGWMANGVKIEGDTYTMPAEDVEITGTYYGPIGVYIEMDWPTNQQGYYGAKVPLRATLTGAEGLDCTLQWQKSTDGINWTDVEGAHEITLTYDLNEETANLNWRVLVTDVKPKQESVQK